MIKQQSLKLNVSYLPCSDDVVPTAHFKNVPDFVTNENYIFQMHKHLKRIYDYLVLMHSV